MDEEKDFNTLIIEKEIDKVKKLFTTREEAVKEALKYYDIQQHEVVTKPQRETKDIDMKHWRLPIANQVKIVQSSADFLVGEPVRLIQESENTDKAFEKLMEIWDEMRMNSKIYEAATLLFSETECSMKFVPYRDADADPTDITKSNSVRCVVLAFSKGDRIYVKFNDFGGLEAVARGYEVIQKNKKIEHFDIETREMYYFCNKDQQGKWEVENKPNLTKKINWVYFMRDKHDSYLVDAIIERRETLSSRRAENNDKMGDPILKLTGGQPISLPSGNDTAKVVVLEAGADAEYLYPQMAVDMIKEERTDLKEIINYITDTPDFSTDAHKSLGQDSGKALIMKFFPAILKAKRNSIQFTELLDRVINVLKAFITEVIDTSSEMKTQCEKLKVSIKFANPLPDNVDELIQMLSTATGGKPIISQEEAAHLVPLIKDGKTNWDKLQQEAKQDSLSFDQL